MRIVFLVLLVSVLHVQCQNLDDDGWKGLTPLKSDEKDVEALFGKGEHDNLGNTRFRQDAVIIEVVFSSGACTDRLNGRYSVPAGKILNYMVQFKEPVELSTLKFKRSEYKVKFDRELTDAFTLRSPSDEVVIRVNKRGDKEFLNTIWVRPTRERLTELRCK
ncbi:MAG: hypothetical protein KA956_07180 [Pyrinomonadaceae bacterium]|nr:hypothetical protein [Pyrinomonadaceae bacterium]